MSVINDRDEHFSGLMDLEGLLNEEAFAVMILPVELDFKGLTEDAEDVVIGVEGSIKDRSDDALGIMVDQSVFEDGFSRARVPEDETKATLLRMNKKDVEDILLMIEQGDVLGIKGILLETKMGANHRTKISWRL